jgi:hypothetical protein
MSLKGSNIEDAFQGFQPATGAPEAAARQRRFQNAVSDLFTRLNKTFLAKQFEFNNDLAFSMQAFLSKFDAIFSLNQDLLEIHYMQTLIQQGKWSGVILPGMQPFPLRPAAGHSILQ